MPVMNRKTEAAKVLAFGLPGNPVSCLVAFHLFVVPAIRCLSGWSNPDPLRCKYYFDLDLNTYCILRVYSLQLIVSVQFSF